MEKLFRTVLIFLIPLLPHISYSSYAQKLNNLDHQEYHQNLCLGKEKITKIGFYFHDVLRGEKPTVWKVAQANITNSLPSQFGLVLVLDNKLTSVPELDSEELGRMQGLVGLADLDEEALVLLLNLVFTKGKYKGSTLSFLGRNPLQQKVREVPIVGGTGVFRMARGYGITRTYFRNSTYAIFEYNLVVSHMDPSVELWSEN